MKGAHIEGITLGAGEEVDDVAGGAGGMGVDGIGEVGDWAMWARLEISLSTRMNGHWSSSNSPNDLPLPVAIHTRSPL